MDCRVQARLKSAVEELARECQQELAVAVTLVDLEELACQMGDEVTRQLTEAELARRGAGPPREEACPDCGRSSPAGEPEPVVLQGLRGEVAYRQPKHYCRHCRRSFFPDGGPAGGAGAEHGDPEGASTGRLGGEQ